MYIIFERKTGVSYKNNENVTDFNDLPGDRTHDLFS